MGGRLGLDEALQQVEDNKVDASKAFEGWSEARIKAYAAIDKKPNTYYYRFNAPGEIQRKGAWTKEERLLFHERLMEIGANGQWGIFSMTIPGRVGYQVRGVLEVDCHVALRRRIFITYVLFCFLVLELLPPVGGNQHDHGPQLCPGRKG